METATNSSRTLEIDGMSGDACVQKVTTALKNVQGVNTQSVKVGSATFDADQTGFNAARAAIGGAGYKVRDSGRAGESNGSSRTGGEHPSGQKGGAQSCTAPQAEPVIATKMSASGGAKPAGTTT